MNKKKIITEVTVLPSMKKKLNVITDCKLRFYIEYILVHDCELERLMDYYV